ncbi:MAG: hypothetical protein R3F34_05705 [Planctomycetota bacterium]
MGFAFFIAAIAIAIAVRIAAGSFDGERVERYVTQRGWKLVAKSWDPFGPGCGDKSDRIYRIAYEDESGDLHEAHVKTSMLSGVYLTNDRIVERAERQEHTAVSEVERLAEENRRLRARVEELERGR